VGLFAFALRRDQALGASYT